MKPNYIYKIKVKKDIKVFSKLKTILKYSKKLKSDKELEKFLSGSSNTGI
jgi:hypothetical protein